MARVVAAIVAAVACLAGATAGAQDRPAVHDTQAWLLLLGQIPVGEDWIVHAEAQPRWNDGVSQRDQLLLRGGLGRRIGPRVAVWAGYAYVPRWNVGVVLHEQRTWQQVTATLPRVGRWVPSLRIRQEQRFLERWGDSSHRFRALGRVIRPLGAGGWSLALWDEYFVTLDETVGGPPRGFDQNRLFATAVRRLSPALSLEAGYLWQVQPATAARGPRHGHTLFTWLTYAPPVRVRAAAAAQ